MITQFVENNGEVYGVRPDGKRELRSEYDGMSTDTKPIAGVLNGDVFYEMDTKKSFIFDEDGQQWLPV